MLSYGVMPGLVTFDSKLAKMKSGTRSLNLLTTCKISERAAKFGSSNDRDVGVFLPRLNKPFVHLIQSFFKKRRNTWFYGL